MRNNIKAEFKKLLTVRSTYLMTLLIIALSCLFTYLGTSAEYVEKNGPPPASQNAPANKSSNTQTVTFTNNAPQKTKILHKDKLAHNILDATGASVFIAVVVILLMAHEFRYNTITYTLTSSNSRSRVLLAKIIVGAAYTIAATALAVLTTVAVTYLAVHIKGLTLPSQDINWLYINARLVGYLLGFSLMGLALITLIRNLTAAIVGLFLLPTLDSLLGIILTKNNIEPSKYLPFSALNRLSDMGSNGVNLPSIPRSAIVFSLYLVALWVVSWLLFLRRDAT